MKAVETKLFIVSKQFSRTPGPRTITEGDFSGELFRQKFLKPLLQSAIAENFTVLIDLDGTAGFGTSFLEEAFGGLIRKDEYTYEVILSKFKFKSNEEPYLIDDINEYLKDAKKEP